MRLLALLMLAGCASSTSTYVAPPVSTEPARFVATGELLPGTDCSTEMMPWWRQEGDRVRLSAGSFSLQLPKSWSAKIDRPDLVVVTAPSSAGGVRPSFEVFVSPICKKYDTARVHARAAARAFYDIMSPDDTVDQVNRGRWSAGLGGAVGRSVILMDVLLRTANGDRIVVLYATDLATSTGFGVHASAACPKGAPNTPKSACEESYFAMLSTVQ